ncbi:major facilitator superfamily domain-containing protein [Haematococcus lacustris]
MHAQAHGADQVALLNNPHLLPVVGLAGCAAGSPSPALLHQVLAPAAQQQRVELEHSLLPPTASDSSQPRQLRPRLELPLPLASVHCQGVEQHAGQGQHLLAAPRASPQGQHLSGAPAGQSSSSSSRPQAPGLPAPAVHHQQPCSSLPLASSPLPLHPDTSPEAAAHSLAGHAAVPGVKPAPPPPAVPIPASPAASSEAAAEGAIPQPIMIICCVSAALTLASCVFNTLLPVYMVTELKMSMRSMGMFEGVLEAISYVVRMFSGVVSDMMSSRKTAITAGFALGALAKFGVVGSSTVAQLFASKAVDRLANGVQAAPRDALISDLAPAASRSACFGFAQSLRKWGSFVGAGLSFLLMKASGNNYKLIFLMAATVSVASCLAFVVLVPNHSRPLTPQQQAAADQQAAYSAQQAQLQAAATAAKPSQPGSSSSNGHGQAGVRGDLAAVRESGAGLRGAAGLALAAPLLPRPQPQGRSAGQLLADVRNMGPDFYRMLLTVSLYGMGHIAEALLEARAIEVGFGKAESTLVVCCLAFVIFLVAYPLGRLDDRYGPRVTFAVGMTALILGNLTLLMSGAHPHAVFLACAFLGVHWGVIQGPMLSIVVGLAPASLRGTAFGIFYSVMAATALAANTLYGSLWTMLGAPAMFATSATLMTATLVALPWLLPASMRQPKQGAGAAGAPTPAAA